MNTYLITGQRSSGSREVLLGYFAAATEEAAVAEAADHLSRFSDYEYAHLAAVAVVVVEEIEPEVIVMTLPKFN